MSAQTAEEVRQSKILYVRDALIDYEAQLKTIRLRKIVGGGFSGATTGAAIGMVIAMGIAAAPGVVVGALMTYSVFRMAAINQKQMEERLRNVLDVWKNDLRGEVFKFRGRSFTAPR
jgi:outer membrane lipoprotein SlyB